MANLRVHSVFDWSVMKKLTFLEALKVNETRKVIEADKGINIGYAFKAGEMMESVLPVYELSRRLWTTEPEKFEFECVIEEFSIPYFKLAGRFLEFKDLSALVGKRTKVTVEAIENES
jgi:hypothetical protein